MTWVKVEKENKKYFTFNKTDLIYQVLAEYIAPSWIVKAII